MTNQNPDVVKTTPVSAPIKPLVIYGGPLYNGDGTVFPDGAIYINKGNIVAVGNEETVFGQIPRSVDMEVYDTLGHVVFPGMINLHHRLHHTFALGLPDFPGYYYDSGRSTDFWWKFDQCLNDEIVQLSAIAGILNSIKAGITTIFDLHSSPLSIKNSLDDIAAVFKRAEVRAALSYEISEEHGDDIFNRGLEENLRFEDSIKENHLVSSMTGLRFNNTTTDKQLALIASNQKPEHGIHVDIASGTSLNRLSRYGLLDDRTLLSGQLSFDGTGSSLIEKSGAIPVISEDTATDYHNGPALMNYPKIGIGTGRNNTSVIAAIRYEFQRLHSVNGDHQTILAFLAQLLRTNAESAKRFLQVKTGILAPGNVADIVIFDYQPVTEMNGDNYLAHILFDMQGAPARAVMTNGKFIYNNHTFLTIDEEIITEECRKASEYLYDKFTEM